MLATCASMFRSIAFSSSGINPVLIPRAPSIPVTKIAAMEPNFSPLVCFAQSSPGFTDMAFHSRSAASCCTNACCSRIWAFTVAVLSASS